MTPRQVGSMILVESFVMAGGGGRAGHRARPGRREWPLAFHVEQVSGYWLPLFVPWPTIAPRASSPRW
jgi:hypothetical protein